MSIKEVKHILVPLDGSVHSKKGLETAIYLAKLTNAEITGLSVAVVYPTLAAAVTKYRDFLTRQFEKQLLSTKEHCEKQGVKFSFKIVNGKPASKIVEFASKNKFELIVIGSRGLSGFKGTVLGSVSNTVTQKSKIPVLVVK